MTFSYNPISINPRSLFIRPEPEAHSGHLRLQLFVSSKDTEAGIGEITGIPVNELIRNEDPVTRAFTGLTNMPAIRYSLIMQ
jgi:hypothetical protein